MKAEAEGLEDWDWILYNEEGFGTTPIYLRSRLLVQYLIEIKGMTYKEIVEDKTIDKLELKMEMLQWHEDK